jgi:two-component system sensor histidine kinase BarA
VPNLSKIWGDRFHGWIWLAVPLAVAGALALLFVGLGVIPASGFATNLARAGIALAVGGLAVLGAVRIGEPLLRLRDVARHLASGRYETRAPGDLRGVTGQLADHLNAVAKQLSQYRDHLDTVVMQTTSRLRQDQERLQDLNHSLREALTESQNSARMQSELFSNLSHELRTPLTGILGYADLLRKSGLDHRQESHLDTLDKSARSLLSMINDLLDWSRIEAGRLQISEETFDLTDVVEDVTALLAPLAYDKDLELVRIVYHDVPRRLIGDGQRLRQVLTNLLSNAIKFTDKGEVVLRVMREREEPSKALLRFSVADTGVGIAPEQQRRLFQPFQQVGRSGTGGSGLGLSITRKLAEMMGGKVELESVPERGSTFSATIPFGLVNEAEARPQPDTRLRERAAWVLEPHQTARLALTHWLEFWGMRVQTFLSATDLSDSLQHAATNVRPDVVILGCRETAIDGAPIQRLLQLCAQRSPPLIALVTSASLEAHERYRRAGASACHPKAIGRMTLQEELVRLTSAGPARGDLPLAGRRVLIADNNLPNRRYLAALCAGLGLEVSEAINGAEALEIWLKERQEMILLDARMPVMDGPTCAREIRRAESSRNRCRILAVSAHLEPEQRRAFLDAGANEVLLKPFDERQLMRALAPNVGAQPAPVSAMLAADPQMLTLLGEELPHQFAELERACRGTDIELARAAAHQLRGTAAFYHLASLRQATAGLEQWLSRTTLLQGNPHLEQELQSVRRAVEETLMSIQQKVTAAVGT